jgi:hypothetical protein
MRIATDTSNSSNPKVEWSEFVPCASIFAIGKSCFLQERQNERPKATVDMQTDVILCSEFAQSHYVVLISIREIDG